MKSKKHQVLIVDDEPAARESLARLVEGDPDLQIVKVSRDGKEAVEDIISLRPDIVFLDIQMPELDGFQVLEAIQHEYLPIIIFVTAFDQYAIKAFEASAIDYLLKPYSDDRFYKSLERAKAWLTNKSDDMGINSLLTFLKAQTIRYANKLIVRNSKNVVAFIPVSEIVYIESEGNFVKIHSTKGMLIGNYTFKHLLEILNPNYFVRIHKSYIANISKIELVEPHFHGDYFLTLKEGTKLKLSRSYKEALNRIVSEF